MEQVSSWMSEVRDSAERMFGQFIEFIPEFLGAVFLIFFGWIVARMLRSAATRLGTWFNGFVERTFGRERARYLRLSTSGIKTLSSIIFWVIILLFVTAATRVLGLLAFSDWLDQVVAYIPTLMAGGFIILIGIVISALVRDVTTAAVASAGVAYGDLFGRGAQAIVLITALIIGINQVGIDVTLLVTLVSILFASICISFALAFALGARSFVSNLIGAHYLQKFYQTGQLARIDGIEGEILELTPTSVIIASKSGRVTVPAKVFNESVTHLLSTDASHG
ncbi:MAG: hypothetical protein R3245_06125 [Kiloniellales bacterium]|nr:hypothetical protein [Kiloniellales bacterium]